MSHAQRSLSFLLGSVWLILVNSALGAEPAAGAPNPAPAGLRNGGFEEGATAWTLKPAADFAQIAVAHDLTAPEGTSVLSLSHRRTRSSLATQQTSLAPFSYYLFSMDVRVGPYLRSGMGFWVRLWADGAESGSRFGESDLGENWQAIQFGVATGATGAFTVQLLLDRVAGDVWVDNLAVKPCRREDLLRIIDSTHPPSSSPQIPLSSPNTAEASVWNDEMPVSTRLPSKVLFDIRRNLTDDVWKRSGRLCLELPAAVQVREEPVQTNLIANDTRRVYTFDGRVVADSPCYLVLTLQNPLGEDRKARFWAEWETGRQEPVELEITEINVPEVRAPKEIVTGTTVYGSVIATFTDYPAAIRSLGFNHLDSWGAGFSDQQRQTLRTNNMHVAAIAPCPGEYVRLLKQEPEAGSTTWTGQRVDVVDLSHTGPVREKFLTDIREYAKAAPDGMMFDDESYVDWNGMDSCVCQRCQAQWRDWLAKNRPGLPPLDPVVALDDPFGHLEHYRAWWYFRAWQLTDWYRDMRRTFLAAVEANQPQGALRPRLAIQSGGPEFAEIKTSRLNLDELAGVFELISPQFYGGGDLVARRTRQLVRAVGRDKACPTLCMGERHHWQPGEFRAQILEALFAGARGYTSWGWHHSNLRVIAEAAETNGALAAHETLLRQGVPTEAFWTEQPGCRVSVLETAAGGLLLVSNYSRQNTPAVVVKRRLGPAMTLSELFTGTTAQLAPGHSDFAPAVRPGTCTLWKWEK